MIFMNQFIVTQNFITALTGNKYFRTQIFSCGLNEFCFFVQKFLSSPNLLGPIQNDFVLHRRRTKKAINSADDNSGYFIHFRFLQYQNKDIAFLEVDYLIGQLYAGVTMEPGKEQNGDINVPK